MGLNKDLFKLFQDSIKLLEKTNFDELSVCIMGDLFIRKNIYSYLDYKKIPRFKTVLDFFTYLKIDCISIDINGKDGALPLDLGKPLKNIKKYDVILNGGTAEHVYDQYICWKNFHDVCKDYGTIISACPMKGNWFGHCKWKYTLEFFNCFCYLNNYIIIDSKIDQPKKNKKNTDTIYISYVKTSHDFIKRDLFVKIWNKYNEGIM